MITEKKKVKLTIIIPVYNGEKFLIECLDSIYNKAYPNQFEVIIIDDGSTDNSLKIIENYRKHYGNIKIKRNSNHGVSYSRNCGIKEANGQFITFLDCDDCFKDNWFETIINNLNNEENVDIIYFSKYFHGNKTKKDIFSYIVTYNNENIKIPGPVSKIFRTNFLKEQNIKFNELLINGEDMLFNIEALNACNNFSTSDKSFYFVRHNNESSTRKFKDSLINSEENFIKKMTNCIMKTTFLNSKEKNIFFDYIYLISIRTLEVRISFITKYKIAKEKFKYARNMEIFRSNLKKININSFNLKGKICFKLFKEKLFLIIYCIFKKKRKIKEDYFELI